MYGDKMFRGVGYPTPLSVPVERACRSALIPADAAWFGLFMGLLETLTFEENWQQFEGGISREDAACYWQEIIDSLYASALGEGECVSCCPIFETDPATGLPRVSYDDGETWDYFPPGEYNPDATAPIAAPPPPLDQGSDAADKCQASANAALVIADFYEQTAGEAAAGLYNTVLNVNKFLYQLNQSLLRLIYPSEAQIAQALGFFNFDWPTYADAPTLTDDQISDLQCLLLENATVTSGVVSFGFSGVRDNVIDTLGVNPGVAVTLLLDYMQTAGLNAAGGVNVAVDADCSDCGWYHDFDFTVDNGGWSAPANSGWAGGTWSGGVGWSASNYSSGVERSRDVSIGITFTSTIVTKVRVTFTYAAGIEATGSARYVLQTSGSNVVAIFYPGAVPSSPSVWTGTETTTSLKFNLAATRNSASSAFTGNVVVSRIEVWGEGTDPF